VFSLINIQKLKHSNLQKLVFITDRQPQLEVHCRGPSHSACCCGYLEQFIPARYFCTFVACLMVTPEDSSFYYFLSQSLTMYSTKSCGAMPPSCPHRNFENVYSPQRLSYTAKSYSKNYECVIMKLKKVH